MDIKVTWEVRASSVEKKKIQCYVEKAEIVNLRSKGYGVQVEGWLFHHEKELLVTPHAQCFSFVNAIRRQDVFDAFQSKFALCSGFSGLFFFPQGEKYHSLSFDFLTESGTLIGELVLTIKSPRNSILALCSWLVRNCNMTNFSAAWHMLRSGRPMEIYRYMQVASSAKKVKTLSQLHLLNPHVFHKKIEEKAVFSRNMVDIIIPVYNSPDLLAALLESILRNTSSDTYHLVLVDDASPDPQIRMLLQRYEKRFSHITVLENKENMGFVNSVNKGLRESNNDVVILNSDTEVPAGWLSRLFAPFDKDAQIASVTPMTNSGAIASFPNFCEDNELAFGLALKDIDKTFQRVDKKLFFEVPTGVGFCMAMKREVLQNVGLFDEKNFSRGYGEENDWCQRAKAKGFKHLILPSLFVWHKHGGSFTTKEKQYLSAKNFMRLKEMYPAYEKEVHDFIQRDPLFQIRFMMMLLLAEKKALKNVLIIIDHEMGGGANLYSERMIEQEKTDRPVVKITYASEEKLFRIHFFYQHFSNALFLEKENHIEQFLNNLGPISFFYNNLVYYPKPLQFVRIIAAYASLPENSITLAMHDFLPVCPSYVLLNNKETYCGVPSNPEQCQSCLPWNKHSVVQRDDIVMWRKEWGHLISIADKILFFSQSSVDICKRVYAMTPKQIEVIPHNVEHVFRKKPVLSNRKELHVGVVGGINIQKGAKIVKNLIEAMERKGTGKLTVIGKLADVSISSNRLHVLGSYDLDDLPDLIEKSGVNVFFIPSIWPETFCYTVSELIELNVPVACFDIGAPPERVGKYPKGLVLPSTLKANDILQELSGFINLGNQ